MKFVVKVQSVKGSKAPALEKSVDRWNINWFGVTINQPEVSDKILSSANFQSDTVTQVRIV